MLTIGIRKIYFVREISKMLEISEKTVQDYCASGKLRGQKIGQIWLVSEQALQEFFEQPKKDKIIALRQEYLEYIRNHKELEQRWLSCEVSMPVPILEFDEEIS